MKNIQSKSLITRISGGALTTIGFILSPLSWWNDLVVNFPLSYVLALPFGFISKQLFLPTFIAAYWITNILGLLMMQKGSQKLLKPEAATKEFQRELKSTLIWGTAYTVLIVVLILSGVLSFPAEFINKLNY